MPFAGYDNFADCVSKNSDKSDPDSYCGSIKNQVEETDKRFSRETEPNLMTPKKQETEPVTLQSTQGESEDEEKDEKREEQQALEQEQTPEEQVPKEDQIENDIPREEEPNDDFEPNPVEPEDKVEYDGENYKLLKISKEVLNGNVIEYDNKFYTPLRLKEKVGEADIDYQGTVYRPRTNTLIEYNNKIYEAVNPHTDTEPAQDKALGGRDNVDDSRPLELPAEEEVSVSGPPAGTEPTVLEDDLKKTGENIVVKTRKGYKKLQVYEVETSSNKLENLKNRGLTKDDKKEDKEAKKKA